MKSDILSMWSVPGRNQTPLADPAGPSLSTVFLHSYVYSSLPPTRTSWANWMSAYVPVAVSGWSECDHWSLSPQSLSQKSMAYMLMDFCLGRLFNFLRCYRDGIFNDWRSNTSPFEDAFSFLYMRNICGSCTLSKCSKKTSQYNLTTQKRIHMVIQKWLVCYLIIGSSTKLLIFLVWRTVHSC